jgi:hypothetical protein
MSVTGLTNDILTKVIRIKVLFVDAIGNDESIICTGFNVLTNKSNVILVTNRHCIDPKLYYGDETQLKVDKIEIEIRENPDSTIFREMRGDIALSQKMDCAVIYNTQVYSSTEENFRYPAIKEEFLADEDFFENSLKVLDTVSFVGYPQDWYDTTRNMPIARIANIASHPSQSFYNDHIKFEDCCLVSGHSVSGSSGSLVVSNLKYPVVKPEQKGLTFEEPKAIGIMSGHFKGDNSEFEHAGLSYFTRSTSILSLLREYDL